MAIAVAHFSVAADFISYRHLLSIPLLVDLFFVLSGLIIAQVYSEKLSRPSAFPEYLVRRFGRIWPLQAATLAVLVLYELVKLVLQTGWGKHFASPAFSPEGFNLVQAIPTNLLLIQSLGLHDRETWDFPSWSLSVEFVTYISFAAFCLIRPVARRVLTIVAIAASLAILMFVAPYHMRSTFDYGLFRCFAGFFAGTLCYDAARKWYRPNWPMPTLIEIGVLVVVIAWMALSTGTVMVFAAPFVFCVFVLGFASERGLLSRVLLAKPLQFFAELSFAIYMVHAIVLIFLLAALREVEHVSGYPLFVRVANPLILHPGASTTIEVLRTRSALLEWSIAIFYFASVLIAAYLAYRFVEVPGRAYFGRLAKHASFAPRLVRAARPDPMEPAP